MKYRLPKTAVARVSETSDYQRAVPEVLERIRAADALSGYNRIIIKPNIVNGNPPPVTTDVGCVAALVDYLRETTGSSIIIAEGSGEGDSVENMKKLGFGILGLPLVDLDSEPCVKRSDPRAAIFREIHLPSCLEKAGLISVPTAKDHTITGVTLGLKNMVGCLPARHYGGYWSYKKSRIHQLGEDRAVADLLLYLEPVITLVDARLGLKGGHLSGTVPNPPLGQVIAGRDVLAVDGAAAVALGHDPLEIAHLHLAGKLRNEPRNTLFAL